MNDPVKCIKCGAVSYNEPGKTSLYCGGCYDDLQAKIDILQKRLNIAVHLNEDTAEGFDWAVLDKAFQYDDLLKRVREAVAELRERYEGNAIEILDKHGLIEDNIQRILDENIDAWKTLAKGDEYDPIKKEQE